MNRRIFIILILLALLCLCWDGFHVKRGNFSLSAEALGNPSIPILLAPGKERSTTESGWILDKKIPQASLPKGNSAPIQKGGLLGKTVIISPGHGFYNKPGYWTTQRGITFHLIEDIHTNEIVMDYLIPYLTRAGARVFSCRERGRQTSEVIVDNDQGSPSYEETGTWTTSSSQGYQGKSYRYATASSTESAKAVFRPNLPESGFYPVYVNYRSNANRSGEALFQICHTGGITEIRVDQSKNGSRWFFLGEFYFEKGKKGSVTLSNFSSVANKVVVADAVRFGGGIGPSGRPRWKESAHVFVPFLGAPLGHHNDVGIRGQYADWQKGDAFLSIHTNAAGGTGTSSYIHNTSPSAGSSTYQKTIHDQFLRDLRALVNPKWRDRGKLTANFGELRNTKTMPALLIELAFHDRPEDAAYLSNEKVRNIMARALYKGILKYLSPGKMVSPLEPTHLMAINSGPGKVTLSWKGQKDPLEPGADAKSYAIYTSINGYGFDNGLEVQGTSVTLSNLTPGALYYFRATALNEGGESLPGETLAVRITPKGQAPKILIINGYDRLDLKSTHLRNNKNTRNYTIHHGLSFARNGYFFDSASNEAVEAGMVELKNYSLLDWALGKESTQDKTFSPKEQSLLQAYLQGGGSLLVSGSEIAWHLGAKGTAQDQDFLKNFLHANYVKDNSQATSAKGDDCSLFSSLPAIEFDDGTHGIYQVDSPDAISPEKGGKVCLAYPSGEGAGIQYSGTYKVLYLAFPIEAVYPDEARDRLVEKAVDFLK